MDQKWNAQLLRLSVFSTGAVSVSDGDWSTITGQPESDTRQNVIGGKRLSGIVDGKQLVLTGRANRADAVLAPRPPAQDDPILESVLPTIGDWSTARDEFVRSTVPWLENFSFPVVRMAFAATILSPQEDRDSAYRQLGTLLKSVRINADRMKEILFRVNVPIESRTVPGLMINRVMTFNAVRFGVKLLEVTAERVSEADPGRVNHGIQIDVDINTQAENTTAFDVRVMSPIYKELSNIASDIVASGEPE